MLRRFLLAFTLILAVVAGMVGTAGAVAPPAATVFISEIHYDNVGADSAEAVEVFGPAGTSLAGWTLVLYNGSGGASYATVNLAGSIPDLGGTGHGVVSVSTAGLQNGSPDGVALVDATNAVRQFLSYEGSFTATNGVANGLTSTDIGVAEAGTEPAGQSLQLVGTGTTYGALSWQAPATASFGTLNAGTVVPPPAAGSCPDGPALSAVYEVQGAGETSPCAGETVVVEGVVVGDYEGTSPTLRGFYVQEDDADVDADPATSEGIFVFSAAGTDLVALGDRVQVSGAVSEFQGQTQLTLASLSVVSIGATVSSASPALPTPSATHYERFEGMKVTFAQTLVVTELFQLGRFGQVVVTSGDRLAQPTQVAAPGPTAVAVQASNNLDRLIIDDASQGQNPDPIILARGGNPLSAANTLRGGDTVAGASGVLTYTWSGNSASGNNYRLRPASPLSAPPTFVARTLARRRRRSSVDRFESRASTC